MSSKNDKCTPPATHLPENKNKENEPFITNGFGSKNDKFKRAISISTSATIPSPRRKRTERTARKVINNSAISARHRAAAYQRIKKAKQPVTEARRIVEQYKADQYGLELVHDRDVDLSDVQKLRIKLIRRDKGIWSPHTDYLHCMERHILSTGMTKGEFKRRSATALKMEQPLSKKFRDAEWKFARTGEWE